MNTLGSLQIKCDKLYSKNQKLSDKNLEYRHNNDGTFKVTKRDQLINQFGSF